MGRDVASKVLKVLLLWLLLLFGVLVFSEVLPCSALSDDGFQKGFLVGGFLAGIVACVITILILVIKKRPPEVFTAKKAYAVVGMMLAVFGIFMVVLSVCYDPVTEFLFGGAIQGEDWYTWVKNLVITDVICLLVVMAMASQGEKTLIEKHKMTFGQFVCAVFMNTGIIGVGAIIGVIIELALSYNFGTMGGGQTISNMMLGSNDLWRILVVGIGAPVVEELIFRKFLIDRVHKYGEGIAIFVSGFLFGLFHGNFSQFFFATGVGLFFAFIYVRTGKIWYSIFLHMIVNMSTSVISVNLLENLDYAKMDAFLMLDMASDEATSMAMELLPSLLLLIGWFLLLAIFVIVGWILWIIKGKKMFLKKSEEYVEKGKLCTAFCNYGMIIFLLLCLVRFISFYI